MVKGHGKGYSKSYGSDHFRSRFNADFNADQMVAGQNSRFPVLVKEPREALPPPVNPKVEPDADTPSTAGDKQLQLSRGSKRTFEDAKVIAPPTASEVAQSEGKDPNITFVRPRSKAKGLRPKGGHKEPVDSQASRSGECLLPDEGPCSGRSSGCKQQHTDAEASKSVFESKGTPNPIHPKDEFLMLMHRYYHRKLKAGGDYSVAMEWHEEGWVARLTLWVWSGHVYEGLPCRTPNEAETAVFATFLSDPQVISAFSHHSGMDDLSIEDVESLGILRDFKPNEVVRSLIAQGKDGWEPDPSKSSTENLHNFFVRYTLGRGAQPCTWQVKTLTGSWQGNGTYYEATLTTCLTTKSYTGQGRSEAQAKHFASDQFLVDPDVVKVFRSVPPTQGAIRTKCEVFGQEKRDCLAHGVSADLISQVCQKRTREVNELFHELGYRTDLWDGYG